MRSQRPALIVIAKAPVAGRVKTRCSPPCSPQQAADLARAALLDTLDAARGTSAGRLVLALDGRLEGLDVRDFDVIPQRGVGLGERLDSAFADVGGPAVLIGMDTPQVSAAMLETALDAVARNASGPGRKGVVGPADDGGFWMLGLSAPVPGLCVDVPMSRDDTCAAVRASLVHHDVAFELLNELVDVDDFETALDVAGLVPGSRFSNTVQAIAAGIQLVAAGRR